MKTLHYIILLVILMTFSNAIYAQVARSYPNDNGIENDTNVLFVEKFNDGLTNILDRYVDKRNTEGMSLDVDVPAGSVTKSLKMTSITGGVNDGGYLFKRFEQGFDSTVYVRYYVKYPTTSKGYFHHEGVWFGGYNPAIDWPFPRAGTCGLGDSRLSIAYENVWDISSNTPGMDTYLYWGDMHSYNDADGCYGNFMMTQGQTDWQSPVSTTKVVDILDQWMCVEIMVKLNNPVTAYNGELTIWQDGVQVGHWGPGTPKGHWLKDKWYNNPADPAFGGFRWRTDAKVNINWLWFEFFHEDPNAPSSSIKFANLVMATKYIGPIYNPTGVNNNSAASSAIRIFPNPTTLGVFSITGLPLKSELIVSNALGEKIFSCKPDKTQLDIDLSNHPKGIYFVTIDDTTKICSEKIIVQ